jgi:hypothetical protein
MGSGHLDLAPHVSLGLLDERIAMFARSGDPRHDEVEVKRADQFQALDVLLPVAYPIKH